MDVAAQHGRTQRTLRQDLYERARLPWPLQGHSSLPPANWDRGNNLVRVEPDLYLDPPQHSFLILSRIGLCIWKGHHWQRLPGHVTRMLHSSRSYQAEIDFHFGFWPQRTLIPDKKFGSKILVDRRYLFLLKPCHAYITRIRKTWAVLTVKCCLLQI